VGWLLIIVVLTHVSAALYHHFVRDDNVLQRMLPRTIGGSEVAGKIPGAFVRRARPLAGEASSAESCSEVPSARAAC
jgi:hypothetical protein